VQFLDWVLDKSLGKQLRNLYQFTTMFIFEDIIAVEGTCLNPELVEPNKSYTDKDGMYCMEIAPDDYNDLQWMETLVDQFIEMQWTSNAYFMQDLEDAGHKLNPKKIFGENGILFRSFHQPKLFGVDGRKLSIESDQELAYQRIKAKGKIQMTELGDLYMSCHLIDMLPDHY